MSCRITIVMDEHGIAVAADGNPLQAVAAVQLALHHLTAQAGDILAVARKPKVAP